MTYNLIDAAIDLMKGNLEIAPPEVAAARVAVCDGCEAQNKAIKTCTACGCFIPAKTKLLESTCPMGLW